MKKQGVRSYYSRVFLAVFFSYGLVSCGTTETPTKTEGVNNAACPAHRATAEGCCPTWTHSNNSGTCQQRIWEIFENENLPVSSFAERVSAVISPDKNIQLVWQEIQSSKITISYAQLSDKSWLQTDLSTHLTGMAGPPSIATGPQGHTVVLWEQHLGETSKIVMAEQSPDSQWSRPVETDSFSHEPKAYEPRVVVNKNDQWVALWNQWYPEHFGVAVATRGTSSRSWVRPESNTDVLSAPVYYSNAPRIALNDNGEAIIVWYQSGGGPLMVYKSERDSNDDSFDKPSLHNPLSPAGGAVDSDGVSNPKVALAANGDAAVVWTQEDGLGHVNVYLALRQSGQWSKPETLKDSFSPTKNHCRDVNAAWGENGELYVVWSERHDSDSSKGEIYVVRRTPEGKWIESGQKAKQLSKDGALAQYPSLLVAENGTAVITWVESADGIARLKVSRSKSITEKWIAPETLSSEDSSVGAPASMAIDPSSQEIVVAWTQGDGFHQTVHIARMR